MIETIQRLRLLGKGLADTTEGFSCKGTVLESRTINVDSRAFLFLGNKGDVRLKLEPSIAAAKKRAAKKPDVYSVGGGGWTKICLSVEIPPFELLEKWVRESYALVAGAGKKKKTKPKKVTSRKSRRSGSSRSR